MKIRAMNDNQKLAKKYHKNEEPKKQHQKQSSTYQFLKVASYFTF